MRTWLMLAPLALLACHHPAAAPATPAAATLPCGASTVDELDPFGKTSVGPCPVVALDGSDRVELREDGVPIMRAGEGKPLRALDARVPGFRGIHVGMTGAEIEAALPDHPVLDCTAFDDLIQCAFRTPDSDPDCGGADADDSIVVELERPGDLAAGDAVPAPRVRDLRVVALLLSVPC